MNPNHLFLSAASQAPSPSKNEAAPAANASDARSTEFRAVQGGTEMQSGEKLLVEAYAAMWVITFVLVLVTWRRQRKTDQRITSLEEAITKAQRDASKAARDSKAAKASKAAGEPSATESANA